MIAGYVGFTADECDAGFNSSPGSESIEDGNGRRYRGSISENQFN